MHTAKHRVDHLAKTVIAKNPHTKPGHIFVQTQSGCLRLTGKVESFYAKQMAQEALRDIEGITEIDNQLEVIWN